MFIHIYLDITLRASMTNVEKKITSFSVVENESIVYITERRERKKFSIPIACISFFFFFSLLISNISADSASEIAS